MNDAIAIGVSRRNVNDRNPFVYKKLLNTSGINVQRQGARGRRSLSAIQAAQAIIDILVRDELRTRGCIELIALVQSTRNGNPGTAQYFVSTNAIRVLGCVNDEANRPLRNLLNDGKHPGCVVSRPCVYQDNPLISSLYRYISPGARKQINIALDMQHVYVPIIKLLD